MNRKDFEPHKNEQKEAITKALSEYKKFKDKCQRHDIIVVINMSAPSYRKRFYVVSMKDKKVVRAHHTSHGSKSSDPNNRAYAKHFSNTNNSHQSSLGAMVTSNTYRGKHGRSLRLNGLEEHKNSIVRQRAIVVHSAHYCTNRFILDAGRAGESWGCPALDPAVCQTVIGEIKEGVFFYVYYKSGKKQ